MLSKQFWIVLLQLQSIWITNASILNVYPRFQRHKYNANPGQPLYLTPLIETGQIEYARNVSRVQLPELLAHIQSYSGYLTVDNKYNSNLFFWFFPTMDNNPNAPVILWLQGGPGASSLFGLFAETGPIYVENGTVNERNITWTSKFNMLYIDNPVGTGYSFTNNSNGYVQNESQVGAQLYTALQQFFKLFPMLRANEFYVAGESYGGKYVPAIAHTIHLNNNPDNWINLQGLSIGNGFSDPINQMCYGNYLYQLGLIDLNGVEAFNTAENHCRQLIKNEQWLDSFECFDRIVNGDTTGGDTMLVNYTQFHFYFNYLYANDYMDSSWGDFVQTVDVRRMIHVGNCSFHDADSYNQVEEHLKADMPQSVVPLLIELLNHYRVMFYNGQLDIIVAYTFTENFLQQMNFSSAAEYKTAERSIWMVDNDIAGYIKIAGNLTEVLVRNAGHMVPADQPLFAFDLIQRFIYKNLTLN